MNESQQSEHEKALEPQNPTNMMRSHLKNKQCAEKRKMLKANTFVNK